MNIENILYSKLRRKGTYGYLENLLIELNHTRAKQCTIDDSSGNGTYF